MKLSQNFTRTSREAPADEVSKNAQLLIRAGYIHKAMPGVYAYLPLGLRMLNKIENIVRSNMNSIGGQEILMNSLHPKEWWLKANRWDNVDILFKVKSQTNNEYAIACSHEEQVVPIASNYIKSYKDLPSYDGVVPFQNNLEAKTFIDNLETQLKTQNIGFAVDCFVVNEKNQILSQKRSANRRLYPNNWELVGGHVDAGETVYQAIFREIKEELSVEIDQIKSFVSKIEWVKPVEKLKEGEKTNNQIFRFIVSVKDIQNIKLEGDKATEFTWIDESNVDILKSNQEGEPNYTFDSVKHTLDILNNKNYTTLPLCVYQIQTKFRDEMRAKSGLLRGREFRMKDMYDFHANKESQDNYYELVKATYHKIYTELGLKSYATTASGGIFTTNISHEFQVECSAGEDWIYQDGISGEVFNEEMAPCKAQIVDYTNEIAKPMEDHLLDGIIGVDALTNHFGIERTRTTKTIFFEDPKGQMIVACVRGDRDVNEAKLMNITGKMLTLATEKTVLKYTGCGIGYAGIINLPKDSEVYYDTSIQGLHNFETGTNKNGYHTTNVCFGRDIAYPSQFVDISNVQTTDTNPLTDGNYNKLKTAEVGNIFKLDDKYTKAFGATYMDENGKPQIPLMNCHGIGTSRCMAIIAELYSDEKGLKLPIQVASFETHLITHISPKDEESVNNQILDIANRVYSGELQLISQLPRNNPHVQGVATQETGVHFTLLDTRNIDQLLSFAKENSSFNFNDLSSKEQILWDDRTGKISIGEKLKDADLIGCPIQIIVSKKSLENGGLEVIVRATGQKSMVKIGSLNLLPKVEI